jgi:hypothetical protein
VLVAATIELEAQTVIARAWGFENTDHAGLLAFSWGMEGEDGEDYL